jgi:predicted PurR-regulated permease PerM
MASNSKSVTRHNTVAPTPKAEIASFVMVAVLCTLVLVYGLLPGLIAVCLGYLAAHALTAQTRIARLQVNPRVAAGVVIVLPVLLVLVLLANAQGVAFGLFSQYQGMLRHIAETILKIRQTLPPDLATYVPDELIAAQKWLAEYLQSRAHALTGFGTAGLRGGILVYVGLIVGALMIGRPAFQSDAPLREAILQRGKCFIASFRQIVLAQIWIAGFNALCTAIFLLVALPLAGVKLPYTSALVALTFFAGLIPIVGNLVCNSVMTIVGVSISPMVGLACLLFLVAIHKFEYFINARIVGKRTNTAAWELLVVMFVGEAIFGVSGLVAAPLYYAYTKKELYNARLI